MDQQTYTHEGDDSAQQIAAQLERDRTSFATSLDALRARFSLDSLLADGATLLQQNAAPYTQSIDRAVRSNPLAVGLTAVGVAWLILGRRGEGADSPPLAGTATEAMARWEDEGGPVAAPTDADAQWIAQTDSLRSRAADLVARIDQAARDRLAPAAALAKSRADVLAALAGDVRRVIATGLDGMTEVLRAQTVDARLALYNARHNVAKAAAAPIRANPALTGTLLMAAGAALAAYLPQTQLEHRVLGPARDRVLDAGKALLMDERLRLASAARHLAQDLRSDIAASGDKTGDTVPNRAAH